MLSRLQIFRTTIVRDALRHLTLDVLSAWQGRQTVLERAGAGRIQFLLLHHVFEHEVVAFRQLLSWLALSYRFIAYSEAVDRIAQNRIDGNYLAISFDDGLACCQLAADVLDQFAAPACFFVCPAIMAETDSARIKQFCRDRLRYPPVKFLTWDDAEQLINHGHEIGGHTMRHVNLNAVSMSDAVDEIAASSDAIKRRLGTALHFAWPYGTFKHFRPELVDAVYAAGYRSCASGVRGCHGRASAAARPGPVCIRRQSVVATWPCSHVNYFLQRAARRPLSAEETWPETWLPRLGQHENENLCTLPSTPSPSAQAAA